jgi:hypothetical protein
MSKYAELKGKKVGIGQQSAQSWRRKTKGFGSQWKREYRALNSR